MTHTHAHPALNSIERRILNKMKKLPGFRIAGRKRGERISYYCVCTVHQERTPSLQFSPSLHFLHCYGCGYHVSTRHFFPETKLFLHPKTQQSRKARLATSHKENCGCEFCLQNVLEPLYSTYHTVGGFGEDDIPF